MALPVAAAALVPLIGMLLKLLIVRIIIATGMTFVTYAGFMVALAKFKSYIVENSSVVYTFGFLYEDRF